MNKAELIRHEIEKRRDHNLAIGNPLFAAMAEEDIELLSFIDSLQEEPASEKKCIFTKDSYTDEDRKVLCENCKEKCEYSKKEEPVSIDFENELYKAFGQVKDFTLGMRIAKRFYDMGKKSREPVSEELEKASKEWLAPQLDKSYANYGEAKMMELTHFDGYAMLDAIEFGAKWQEEQMMTKAVEGGCFSYKNGFVHISCDIDEHLTDIKMGDKVKVIVIKED